MIRRSFRIGLWLGLLAGAGFALAKIFRPKPGPSPVLDLGSPGGSLATSPNAWPPLEAPVATPAPVQVPEPEVEPAVATDEPGLVLVGDEPMQTPLPEPDPIPDPVPEPQPAPVPDPTPAIVAESVAVASAPAKKIAVKKKAASPAKAAPAKKVVAKKAAAPAKKAAAPKKKLAPWVDPKGTVCPKTHPVKGKLSSMIFQVPGNFAYERTTPDRCYATADAAEDDGLRAAKR